MICPFDMFQSVETYSPPKLGRRSLRTFGAFQSDKSLSAMIVMMLNNAKDHEFNFLKTSNGKKIELLKIRCHVVACFKTRLLIKLRKSMNSEKNPSSLDCSNFENV